MPSIGPQLPPELQKRKRSDGEDEDNESSDSSTGPGPALQPERRSSPPSTKRARVVGPAPPPAPLDERPPNDPMHDDEDSESDDDGFGPSLPSTSDAMKRPSESSTIGPRPSQPAASATRDEWMTLAPTNGDWSSRVDPTKLKSRKFNTGKGSKAPMQSGSGGDTSWHETPEQKQERLKREMMGIKDTSSSAASSRTASKHDAYDDATSRRLKEYNVCLKLPHWICSLVLTWSLCHAMPTIRLCVAFYHPLCHLWSLTSCQETQRGPSLYANHAASRDKPLDDDPSARAFDREKDIGSGSTINATKRREMVKNSTNFSSRFEKARYL